MPQRNQKPEPLDLFEVDQSQIETYIGNQGRSISEFLNKNRGTDYSMKNDTVKDVSINLEDIDSAIIEYINNNIKPTVIQDSNQVPVRVIYGSPERWKSVQADGFLRDSNGHINVPIIMIKRDGIEKIRSLGNKIDGNAVALYQIIGEKYNQRNAYDKFSVLNNRIPSKQLYITTVPDYLVLNYNCIIFTNFVEQNNKIVEAIEFASDSYWGDPDRFKFRTVIDSFTTPIVIENGGDRAAKSTFNIKVNGYIIPDNITKDLSVAKSKYYTKSQIIFDMEVVDADGQSGGIDQMRFANKTPAKNTMSATSFIGGGVNITNNNVYNITGSISSDDSIYLNTNKQRIATEITVPNIATFGGVNILQPPSGSSLPATTVANFTFYINGQYVPSSIITLSESGQNVIAIFNTSQLGYVLETDDEVVAIGKFIVHATSFGPGFDEGFD